MVKLSNEEVIKKEKKMEKNNNYNLKLIWKFVKGKRILVILSMLLSVLSSISSFIPYWAIYKVIETLLKIYPNIVDINSEKLISYGWLAFTGVTLNIGLYFLDMICSHLGAFG